MANRILVVDDDRKIVRLVQSYLQQSGMIVLAAYDGDEAMQMIRRERPDLIVLDIMLPGQDGWTIARWLRSDAYLAKTPILMLTARIEDSDKIYGFELGTDDYLTKPFNPEELVARVKAVLRRAQSEPQPSRVLQIGTIRLDIDQHLLTVNDHIIPVTPTEFALLRALMEYPSHTFTRGELIERALGYTYDGMERTLDSHIKNLRKKIEPDPTKPNCIETVYGIGYRFREGDG